VKLKKSDRQQLWVEAQRTFAACSSHGVLRPQNPR
jgi:hypothetical protein